MSTGHLIFLYIVFCITWFSLWEFLFWHNLKKENFRTNWLCSNDTLCIGFAPIVLGVLVVFWFVLGLIP